MQQEEEQTPEFQWEESVNCPPGYPVEVYRGGFELPYVSLNNGTATGISGWGYCGGGMSYGIKPLPREINCIWVSYAEGCMYKIKSPIDYNKLLKLFQEGYQDSNFFFNGNGEYKKTTFNHIVAGFAPGGVVVIWASGAGRQVEIGRYKGSKFEVPQAEIDRLDSHESLLFSANEYDRIMHNTQIVPLEVRKAHAGKPIPYGLWDRYRTKYTWRPVVEVQQDGVIAYVDLKMFNGEKEELFAENLKENKFEKRAIIKFSNFGWRDAKGQGYGCKIDFDEETIIKAFQEMYKDDKEGEAELVITVNHSNNFVTAMLKHGNKEIFINKGIRQNVYKSRQLTIEKK